MDQVVVDRLGMQINLFHCHSCCLFLSIVTHNFCSLSLAQSKIGRDTERRAHKANESARKAAGILREARLHGRLVVSGTALGEPKKTDIFYLIDSFRFSRAFSRRCMQQYNDTSNTLKQLRDIFQDQFADTAQKKVSSAIASARFQLHISLSYPQPSTTTTPAPGEEPETTTEGYRISRKEFGEILGRNLRGLRKLARIELNDSYNVNSMGYMARVPN
jgi:hypothetical protein